VGTATADTRDTGDGATGAPRFGGRGHAAQLAHGVRLAPVLAHLVVDVADDVGPDGRLEDAGQLDFGAGDFARLGVDVD